MTRREVLMAMVAGAAIGPRAWRGRSQIIAPKAIDPDFVRMWNEAQTARPRVLGSPWVETDDQGRFRLDTTHPGPYPGRFVAAHIHMGVQIAGRQALLPALTLILIGLLV